MVYNVEYGKEMKNMKANRDEMYKVSFWAIECPNCGEQIELDSRYASEIFCPFCNVDWIWEKSIKTNFLNAKKQPLRRTENISIFSK